MQAMEKEKVTVSEADQLSPVALTTRAANPLPLPPLQWCYYDSMPAAVYARNTGFTVMIQASFQGETPYLHSGPLGEKYRFSQIHFHWGEHDETGSGHSVDGVRFPLEMHVVHAKKDFANPSESGGTKYGIAITVHLFSLMEQRNAALDQLTAVLQFIKRPDCCARLYPSSLAELVHPFCEDYFLYWGAAAGAGRQHFRIVWLVSRRVLPVSSQQLQQFRELLDTQGNFIWSNSNKPHPLGDRSLFLVSPYTKTDETAMSAISHWSTRSGVATEDGSDDDSIVLQDAEFKSLAVLQETEGSCAICPHPNHAAKPTVKLSKYSVKINKGDTSVEESCIDLRPLKEPRDEPVWTSKRNEQRENEAKRTNANPTICGTSCTAKYIPSQDNYSIILANENEIHLKRKPMIVKKSDPSTEQACMFLTKPPPVHSAHSAPSLTTWGHLRLQKECANISEPQKHNVSEKDIFNESLESLSAKSRDEINEKLVYSRELKTVVKSVTAAKKFQDVATQRSENVQTVDTKEQVSISMPQTKNLTCASQNYVTNEINSKLKHRDNNLYNDYIFDDELFKPEYLLVKKEELKNPFYKVIGEFLITPNSKRTFVKHGQNANGAFLSEVSDGGGKNEPIKARLSKNKTVSYQNITTQSPTAGTNKNEMLENIHNKQQLNSNRDQSQDGLPLNLYPRVKVEEEKPIPGQLNIRGKNEEVPRQYYVTRITPVSKSQQENSKRTSEKKLYYAQPIMMTKDANEVAHQSNNDKNITNDETNYTTRHNIATDPTLLKHMETQYTQDDLEEYPQNIPTNKSFEMDNKFNNRHKRSLDNGISSNHLLMKKVETPYEGYDNAKTLNTFKNKDFIDSVPSSLATSHLPSEMTVMNLHTQKSQTVPEYKKCESDANRVVRIQFASNEHEEQSNTNKTLSGTKHDKPIKMAVSVQTHGENSKTSKVQNPMLQKDESTENETTTTTIYTSNQMETPSNIINFRDFQYLNVANSHESNGDLVKEEIKKSTVHSSHVSKKKITIKVTGPTYKIASQNRPISTDQSSSHLVTVQKVEIPDPSHLTRVPRGPLVEYQARTTVPNQQVETVQTEETKSEVKTIEHYTTVKRGNQSKRTPVNHDDRNEKQNNSIQTGTHQLTEAFPIKKSKPISHPVIYYTSDDDYEYNETNPISFSSSKSDTTRTGGSTANNNQTSSENHENVIVNQMYRSKIKYVDVATSNPTNSLPLKSKFSQGKKSQILGYNNIDEKPTKDTGFNTFAEEGSPNDEKSREIMSINMDRTREDKFIPRVMTNDPDIINETDGLNHQIPTETTTRAVVTETEREIRPRESITIFRKPRVADKSEELLSTHNYESEEKVTNPPRCNVIFKNETKFELPSGHTAFMKSMAEVTVKPSRKSFNFTTSRFERNNLTDQTTMTMEDKCCSAIDWSKDKLTDDSSVDTSTSVELDGKGNKSSSVNYSAVKIETNKTEVKLLPPLKFTNHWNRNEGEDALLENNGKTVRATLLNEVNPPRLNGGLLGGDYTFAELHFHWGRKDCCGAEHLIDGQRYSMEAHFLYFKEDYGSVKEALKHEDGLAMVAIQLNVGGPSNVLFGQLVKDVGLINEADTGVYVSSNYLFAWIKPTVEESGGYFSYKGSLTSETPNFEAVTWHIFREPVIICCQQTLEFRKLMSPNGELILKTFRTLRPANERTVFFVPL